MTESSEKNELAGFGVGDAAELTTIRGHPPACFIDVDDAGLPQLQGVVVVNGFQL